VGWGGGKCCCDWVGLMALTLKNKKMSNFFSVQPISRVINIFMDYTINQVA